MILVSALGDIHSRNRRTHYLKWHTFNFILVSLAFAEDRLLGKLIELCSYGIEEFKEAALGGGHHGTMIIYRHCRHCFARRRVQWLIQSLLTWEGERITNDGLPTIVFLRRLISEMAWRVAEISVVELCHSVRAQAVTQPSMQMREQKKCKRRAQQRTEREPAQGEQAIDTLTIYGICAFVGLWKKKKVRCWLLMVVRFKFVQDLVLVIYPYTVFYLTVCYHHSMTNTQTLIIIEFWHTVGTLHGAHQANKLPAEKQISSSHN